MNDSHNLPIDTQHTTDRLQTLAQLAGSDSKVLARLSRLNKELFDDDDSSSNKWTDVPKSQGANRKVVKKWNSQFKRLQNIDPLYTEDDMWYQMGCTTAESARLMKAVRDTPPGQEQELDVWNFHDKHRQVIYNFINDPVIKPVRRPAVDAEYFEPPTSSEPTELPPQIITTKQTMITTAPSHHPPLGDASPVAKTTSSPVLPPSATVATNPKPLLLPTSSSSTSSALTLASKDEIVLAHHNPSFQHSKPIYNDAYLHVFQNLADSESFKYVGSAYSSKDVESLMSKLTFQHCCVWNVSIQRLFEYSRTNGHRILEATPAFITKATEALASTNLNIVQTNNATTTSTTTTTTTVPVPGTTTTTTTTTSSTSTGTILPNSTSATTTSTTTVDNPLPSPPPDTTTTTATTATATPTSEPEPEPVSTLAANTNMITSTSTSTSSIPTTSILPESPATPLYPLDTLDTSVGTQHNLANKKPSPFNNSCTPEQYQELINVHNALTQKFHELKTKTTSSYCRTDLWHQVGVVMEGNNYHLSNKLITGIAMGQKVWKFYEKYQDKIHRFLNDSNTVPIKKNTTRKSSLTSISTKHDDDDDDEEAGQKGVLYKTDNDGNVNGNDDGDGDDEDMEMNHTATLMLAKYELLRNKVPSYSKTDMWYQLQVKTTLSDKQSQYSIGCRFLRQHISDTIREFYRTNKEKIMTFINDANFKPVHNWGIGRLLLQEEAAAIKEEEEEEEGKQKQIITYHCQPKRKRFTRTSLSNERTNKGTPPPPPTKKQRVVTSESNSSSPSPYSSALSASSSSSPTHTRTSTNDTTILDNPVIVKLRQLHDELKSTRQQYESHQATLHHINDELAKMTTLQKQKDDTMNTLQQLHQKEKLLMDKLAAISSLLDELD